MNKELETAFVKNFIKKQYQERLLFELNSPKKREDFIWRFCHRTEVIVNPQRIILKGTKIAKEDLDNEIKQIKGDVYVLSLDYPEGQMMNVQEALAYFEDEYMPVIIMFADNLAFIKTEVEYGAPEKYLLGK